MNQFILEKNLDFQSQFEEGRSSITQQGRMSSASLLAGTEPNFSSDMTVQPPVRKDLLLSSYQWGRGYVAHVDEDMKML